MSTNTTENGSSGNALIRCRYNSKKRFVWQLFATIGGREYFAHQWFKRPSQKEVKNTIGANWSDATAFRLSEGSTVTRGKWKRSNDPILP